MSRRLLVILLLCVACGAVMGQRDKSYRSNAWDRLVRNDPSLVDSREVNWLDRLILNVLTPEQAESYYQGADTGSLVLANGQTLEEYLDARLSPPGSVYIPLPAPCALFGSVSSEAGPLLPGQGRGLSARGRDLSWQGGSATGCQIPEEAVALMMQLRVEPANGPAPRVKMWAADMPEPAEALVEGGSSLQEGPLQATAVIPLCTRDECQGGELQISTSEVAEIDGQVLGYFRALSSSDQPGGGISFSTESSSNNLFGIGAGASITTASGNSFFGANAGTATTSGSFNAFFGINAGAANNGTSNSFFGSAAGLSNTIGINNSLFGRDAGSSITTGSGNSMFGKAAGLVTVLGFHNVFVGMESGSNNTGGGKNTFVGWKAGLSNTTELGNTFIGDESNGAADITNATALGYLAQVSQSNSVVLGSINGLNGATSSVNVGIGTDTPEKELHVQGDSDAIVSANNTMLRVENVSGTTGTRRMLELINNGVPLLVYRNTADGTIWSMSPQGTGFSVSKAGTGMTELFLSQTGDLVITGDLTANGTLYTSDRNKKTDLEPLEPQAVLAQLMRVPVSTWRFYSDEKGLRRAGPMAQDFYAAFGLGKDNRHINAADISGIAVASIQGLYQKLQEKESRIAKLEAEMEAQQVQIQKLLELFRNSEKDPTRELTSFVPETE